MTMTSIPDANVTSHAVRLASDEREMLARLADVLIPPAANGVSASAAGIAGSLLDMAEQYAPDVSEKLRIVITGVAGREPQAALAALRAGDPLQYDAFCETIAAIYFMSPTVRAGVGFPGREAKPARIDVSDLEDLLLPVLEAGFAPR